MEVAAAIGTYVLSAYYYIPLSMSGYICFRCDTKYSLYPVSSRRKQLLPLSNLVFNIDERGTDYFLCEL